jgi:hypothetical protein
VWRTSDAHNWVSSLGRQRHVDPVHSGSPKGQMEAGERRVALSARWRRNPVSRPQLMRQKQGLGGSVGSGADVLAASVRSRSGVEETPREINHRLGQPDSDTCSIGSWTRPPPSPPTSLVSASLLTFLISSVGCSPSSSPTRSQPSSAFSAFKVSESSNSTASNPGHPTNLTLSMAGSFVSCAGG